VEPPEPIDPNFRIEVGTFEGPLDLLLHLIQKHELDILDLPIGFVTERYVSYITMMRELDLDMASEYLVMAATLAHIKSRMLLPQSPEDEEVEPEEEVDPREELIRRLLEYQKYKLAAEGLGDRPIAGRDVFVRGTPEPVHDGPAPLAAIGLFKLLDAFEKLLEKTDDPGTLEITAERISIQERMSDLIDTLRERRRVVFEDLFGGIMTRYDLVVTFLATLEMVKLKLVRIYQSDPHSPLHIEYRILDASAAEPESASSALEDSNGAAPTDPEPAT
jgi:segregation and condensation protein A